MSGTLEQGPQMSATRQRTKIMTDAEWESLSPESRHCINLWQIDAEHWKQRVKAATPLIIRACKMTGTPPPWWATHFFEPPSCPPRTLRAAVESFIAAAASAESETK